MKKSELVPGMLCYRNDGSVIEIYVDTKSLETRYLIVGDDTGTNYSVSANYPKDLSNPRCDIVKVLQVVWEQPILEVTMADLEKKYGCKVKVIK